MIAASAPPVGENFASHAFRCVLPRASVSSRLAHCRHSHHSVTALSCCPRRVRTFQAEALATLDRFGAALADCSTTDGPPDLDVSDLRVPPLQEELEAVSRDEAAGIAGPPAVGGTTGTDGAFTLATDGDAGGTPEATPASSGDAAARDGDGRVLELAPPQESGAAHDTDCSAAQSQDGDERDGAAVQQSRGARTRSRSAQKPAGAGPPRKRGRRAAQSSSARAAATDDTSAAAAAKSAGMAAAMEELREADADAAMLALCDELRPQGVHAVGRRLRMFHPKDESWHIGKVTHFNRRSGKHRVLFEHGSTDVRDLATERLVFLPAADASEAEDDDDDDDNQHEGKEPGVEREKPLRLGTKRLRSQALAVAQVPPSQRCAALS